MRPIILKLLKQEPVTQGEWQDLFYSVHVCLWDDKGPPKLRDALQEDIMDFIKQAQLVREKEFIYKLKSRLYLQYLFYMYLYVYIYIYIYIYICFFPLD